MTANAWWLILFCWVVVIPALAFLAAWLWRR